MKSHSIQLLKPTFKHITSKKTAKSLNCNATNPQIKNIIWISPFFSQMRNFFIEDRCKSNPRWQYIKSTQTTCNKNFRFSRIRTSRIEHFAQVVSRILHPGLSEYQRTIQLQEPVPYLQRDESVAVLFLVPLVGGDGETLGRTRGFESFTFRDLQGAFAVTDARGDVFKSFWKKIGRCLVLGFNKKMCPWRVLKIKSSFEYGMFRCIWN